MTEKERESILANLHIMQTFFSALHQSLPFESSQVGGNAHMIDVYMRRLKEEIESHPIASDKPQDF